MPLGVYLTIRLIPPPVLAAARREADAWLAERRAKPRSYWAAVIIVAVASTLSALVVLRKLRQLDLIATLKAPE